MWKDLTPDNSFEQPINSNSQIKTKVKMEKVEGKVRISKKVVLEKLNSGFTKEEIRDELYPSLNDSQWKAAIKAMGLSSYRAKKVDFLIEDEDLETELVNVPKTQFTNPIEAIQEKEDITSPEFESESVSAN